MEFSDAPNILAIYLEISQYPILARDIRRRMRLELHRRGVVTYERLEREAKEKAILSQYREGLTDPFVEEDVDLWERRLERIRDDLTDFYFAYNLPLEIFRRIVEEVLDERAPGRGNRKAVLSFNPELAPVDLLIRKLVQFESVPEEQQAGIRHDMEEIRVVLIKTMISDHLDFVRVAKNSFTTSDFEFIRLRRIGGGKIGGKAAGMLLAWQVLRSSAPDLAAQVVLPDSYFIGADVFYDFMFVNSLEYINQKYKTPAQIEAEYPRILEAYEQGGLPEEVTEQLRALLARLGKTPIIVRSSSLLEDNFGASFAGKYASYFCPNQGALDENLADLSRAVRRIYASVFSPDAIFYRRHMGLLDYDERMAILIQQVQGKPYHHYFFPELAGVAFGRSPIAWNPRLRPEEGFVRLVMGLGTRAVDRVGEDYPRLITLSHPQLRPEVTPEAIEYYSQHFVDLIDVEANAFKTIPVRDLLNLDYPALRWVASIRQEGTLLPIYAMGDLPPESLVLTFDNLLQKTGFVQLLKSLLATLNQHYGGPVDLEFTVSFEGSGPRPNLALHLLQCRPQSSMHEGTLRPVPKDLAESDKIFVTRRMVPHGYVGDVEYIVYVDPDGYDRLPDSATRYEVARCVGRLNKALEGRSFILIGPGRWGSSNIGLGVPVTYADIFNAKALIELALTRQGIKPEPSYGTHFFQDLVESHIYPLAVYPDEPGDMYNQEWLLSARNRLHQLAPQNAHLGNIVRVVHVPSEQPGHYLEIAMDGKQALAYLRKGIVLLESEGQASLARHDG